MIWAELLGYLLIGGFSGIAAGLLGIGGGLIIVPFLLIMFVHFTVIPYELQVHVAIATSLASIIFTSLSAIYSQQRKRAIEWNIFFLMLPGILLGSFLGAWFAGYLPRQILLAMFAVFVILVGLKMWFGWSVESTGRLPGRAGIGFAALLIGMISAIVGIGGGTMSVPFLSRGGIAIHHAVALSSALGLPIAIFGTLGFIFSSLTLNTASLPLVFGYVYVPALFALISASILTAPLGVHISHILSQQHLRKVFAVLLFILAAKLFGDIL